MYRKHSIKIRLEDENRANVIIQKHWNCGEIDDISNDQSVEKDDEGNNIRFIIYRIAPYIYEDFESIINEFKQNGIQVY